MKCKGRFWYFIRMQILKPGCALPAHMRLATSFDELAQIHAPDVNLVVLPLDTTADFNSFAAAAHAKGLSGNVPFRFPLANGDRPINEQLRLVHDGLHALYQGLPQADELLENVRGCTRTFCHLTDADELTVRQTSRMAVDNDDMKPHVDVMVDIRGLLDLSRVGMVAYDQTGLSPGDVQQLGKRSFATADLAENAVIRNELAARAIHIPGPAMMVFKGLWGGNPLLHGAVPTAQIPADLREPGFRPCWRMDSYYW